MYVLTWVFLGLCYWASFFVVQAVIVAACWRRGKLYVLRVSAMFWVGLAALVALSLLNGWTLYFFGAPILAVLSLLLHIAAELLAAAAAR